MFLAFPALILALVIAASLGPGLVSATIALSMAFWPWYARLLRGQVLSLKNLAAIEDTLTLLKETRGIRLDIDRVPLDDPKVYAMLRSTQTLGVFLFLLTLEWVGRKLAGLP